MMKKNWSKQYFSSYIEVDEQQLEKMVEELEGVGLKCYPEGNFVKSLRTCNFCKGAVQEGMPTATKLNDLIAGKPVPFMRKTEKREKPLNLLIGLE